MNNFLKHVPGFRTNTKWKMVTALMYYSYCIFLIPSNFIGAIGSIVVPYIFFAIKDRKKLKVTVERKPIIFNKKLNIIIAIVMVCLLGTGAISASAQNKKDAQLVAEKKVIAIQKGKDAAAAKVISDAKAVEDKKIADLKAIEDKKAADIQAVKDKETARLQAIEDKKVAAALAKEEKIAYDTGITYDQLARNPDTYMGKKVKFSGKVIQVMEGDTETQLRIAVNGNYDNVMLAGFNPSIIKSRILENDQVNFKGKSVGVITYESTMGGNITIPGVFVDSFN